MLPCKHKFHADCIRRWVESEDGNRTDCPMCRGRILYAEGVEVVNYDVALMIASKDGYVEVVQRLLANVLADVDFQHPNGWTALMVASQNGHDACVKALIDAKADVDLQNKDGLTALILAALWNHEACVKALVDAKANLNVQQVDGWTALMFASQ